MTGARNRIGFEPDRFVPKVHPQTVAVDRGEAETEHRHVAIRRDTGDYALLSPGDHQVWQLIDGKRTVSEITRLYLEKHRRLALTRVYSLVRHLYTSGLIYPPAGWSDATDDARRLPKLANVQLMPVPGSGPVARLLGSWLSRLRPSSVPFHLLLLVPIVAGAGLAVLPASSQSLPILELSRPLITMFGKVPAGFAAGLVTLLLLHLLLSLLRELWRAGIEAAAHDVPGQLNLVMHYGIPCFQSDGRYRPTLPRRQRLATACAGIEFELALAGIATIAVRFLPAGSMAIELATKLSWLCYCRTLMHLSPLAAADLAGIFSLWGDIRDFQTKALRFLRRHFFEAIFGDAELNSEQKLYVGYHTVVAGWMLLIILAGNSLLRNNQLAIETLTNFDGSAETVILAVAAIMLLPVAACTVFGILSFIFVFLGWFGSRPALQRPTVAAVACSGAAALWLGIVVLGAKVNAITASASANLLYGGAMILILAAGLLSLKIGDALAGGRWLARLRVSQSVGALLLLLLIMLSFKPVAAGSLAYLPAAGLALWLVWSLVSGTSALSIRRSRLLVAELSSLVGAILLLAGCLSVAGHFAESADLPVVFFAATSLFVIGVGAAVRGCLFWPTGPSRPLPINEAQADRTTVVQEVGTHVIQIAGREIRVAFGDAALRRIARAAGETEPLDFETPSSQLGNDAHAYRNAIAAIGAAITKTYGATAADLALSRALRSVHWRGRLVLHRDVLPETPWAKLFANESAIRPDARRQSLESIVLFQDLTDEQLRQIADRLVAERIPPGEPLVRQGDEAQRCFFISSGEVQVEEEDDVGETHVVTYLTDGEFFGEAALLAPGTRRSATVRAITSTLVLTWSRQDFLDLADDAPATVKQLVTRLNRMRVLLGIPLFADLPPHALRTFLPKLRNQRVQPGETIIKQGESGNKFYLIQSGTVEVIKVAGSQEIHLCDLQDGEYFGEIALLQDLPRTATVRAKGEARLLVLGKSDFLQLTTTSDLFATNLSSVSKDRLASQPQ